MRHKRPRVYFSFRSPFSWMAILKAGLDHDQLEFVPYWDPDPRTEAALKERGGEFHYVQMSKAKHLYILQDTKRQAARLNLAMRWPIDIDPWWEVPHLAFLMAREQDAEAAFYREATAARWERGEDICTPEVIAAVAERAGLDGAELAAATEDPKIREQGVDCLYQAYHDDIFGIPYFRTGRHRFWGLDRVDDFLDAVDRPTPSPATPAVTPATPQSYDTDTAGGCG
jgi:2-hydroxychromene-2-carboxylate isomerase